MARLGEKMYSPHLIHFTTNKNNSKIELKHNASSLGTASIRRTEPSAFWWLLSKLTGVRHLYRTRQLSRVHNFLRCCVRIRKTETMSNFAGSSWRGNSPSASDAGWILEMQIFAKLPDDPSMLF
ncbi:hypothetical protein J6590_095625 [Homalodisca vitripennis]|nr:hypothetical protein J6590_095625 [Homalodisca vitripennis]